MAILGVPKKVCISVESTNIFEKLGVTVLYRTKITGDSDSMRERLLASVKMTEFQNSKGQVVAPRQKKQSKHNYYKAQQF